MTTNVPKHALCALALVAWAGCRDPVSIDGGSRQQLPKVLTNSIGMQLVLIPAGEFTMGSLESDLACEDSKPQHSVRITKPFYLGVYEVTQEEYEDMMADRPSHFYSDGLEGDEREGPDTYSLRDNRPRSGLGSDEVAGLDTSRFPVDQVTWGQASEFCRRLSDQPVEEAAGRSYRLPTEAEWEYACRAGTTTPYSFGNVITLAQANISQPGADEDAQPLKHTAEVGSYPSNAFGLYDMHGNVWEWCADGKRKYARSAQTDPNGGPTLYYILRGGGWDFPAHFCRSDYRNEALAGYVYFGFRVACEVDGTLDGGL